MSYTRPAYNAADATWEGANEYTRPSYNASDADFSLAGLTEAYVTGVSAAGSPQAIASQSVVWLQAVAAVGNPQAQARQQAALVTGVGAAGVPQALGTQQVGFVTGLSAAGSPQTLASQQVGWAEGVDALGIPQAEAHFGYLVRLQTAVLAHQPQILGHFGYLVIPTGQWRLGTPQATGFALPALAENVPEAITYYHCKLTGAHDGLADAVLPISSFSVRHRYDGPSYYQLTIPSYAYVAAITARPHGQIVIWSDTGGITEELMRGDLASVRSDRGPLSQSISISGNSTRAATTPVTYLIANALYAYSTFEGEARLRIPPRAAIRPGDYARYADLNFQIGEVSWSVSVSAGGMAINMEVTSLAVDA